MKIYALPKTYGFGSFQITFYATVILLGALLALVISKYRIKKRGYNPKDIDNLFLVAFPSGLVGARIWYCCWQWKEFVRYSANGSYSFWLSFLSCLGIEDGSFVGLSGLAIQGGVLLGVIVGLIFLKKYRKHMRILDVVDACVPSILVAQAVGRWGNFFNQEVYGKCVDVKYWSWLGNWFIEQMSIGECSAANGVIANPLFLIEGIINIVGFIFFVFILDRLLRKYMKPGVISAGYFVFYGLVRIIMEPLRNEQFIMSTNGSFSTSRFTAFLFVGVGVLLITAIYLNHYLLKPRNKDVITLLDAYSKKIDSLKRYSKIIIQAIPLTGWINSFMYRFSKDNFACAILSLILGPIFWIIDLIYIIVFDKMGPYSNGKGIKYNIDQRMIYHEGKKLNE